MEDFDPSTAASLDDLAACLRHVHLLADKPAYRALEQQTAHQSGNLPGTRLARVRLTRSVLSDVLNGRKFPGKAFLLTFVHVCGIDLENDLRWEQAWNRLASHYQHAAAETDQQSQELLEARAEIQELRQQLTAAKRPAATVWCLGCGGTIVDGYCDTCGLAPLSRRRARLRTQGRLWAGLAGIPRVPLRDPASAVLVDPQVPESRRFCSHCGQPVGRGKDGRAGLADGFCGDCGIRFEFSPKLERGELVAGQYEVLGCLAHGGLGWIYLARDHMVGGRWVVLKGLPATGDLDAMAAAEAERRLLAEIEHPGIVRIYNCVQHADRRTGEQAGYIVMEYIHGKTLKQIGRDARMAGGSVPLAHALAYVIEVLPALGYLHDRGLVYCDFKPDHVIIGDERLVLIDVSSVRTIDSDLPIYGTVGYQAPEIETDGPSPSSDLYTVGRTLAQLTFEFPGFHDTYKHSLPDGIPLLEEQESFARLLRRATHRDPQTRFGSAAEMAGQLTGVLREVLTLADAMPRPAVSTLFSPEVQVIGTRPDLRSSRARAATITRPPAAEIIGGLPLPRADPPGPASGYLAELARLGPVQRADALTQALSGGPQVPHQVTESAETRLALAWARIEAGNYDEATDALADLAAEDPDDWRIAWYHGLCQLMLGKPQAAMTAFSAVYDQLPGELAPKLALALAAEAVGDMAKAGHYFRLVWTIDQSCISAGLGVVRSLLAAGDQPGAIAVLASVPITHFRGL